MLGGGAVTPAPWLERGDAAPPQVTGGGADVLGAKPPPSTPGVASRPATFSSVLPPGADISGVGAGVTGGGAGVTGGGAERGAAAPPPVTGVITEAKVARPEETPQMLGGGAGVTGAGAGLNPQP